MLIEWLASDSRSAQVAAWGFVLTLLGFAATLAGLWYTFRQAQLAAEAATKASGEVESFKGRLRREAASRDVATAVRALMDALGHLEDDEVSLAREPYEVMRRAVIKLNANDILSNDQSQFLDELHDHILSFSDDVGLYVAKKGRKPDPLKALRYLKQCHLEFVKIDADLMKDL